MMKTVETVEAVDTATDTDTHTGWTLRTCDRLGEHYRETRHKSGLRVLVCPKDFGTYHATLTVRYGSVDRLAGVPTGRYAGHALPMGVAHFLEHKMFERDAARYGGSDSFDDDFAALGAEANAYTSYDRTAYYFSCTDRFDETLESLLRMVTEFSVTSASVARERAIIAEEIRMNTDDPWERCSAEARTALYGRHPVQEEICGSEASLRRITPAVLRAVYDAFYRPDRMVLTVCGQVTPEAVMATVDRVMGVMPQDRADHAAPVTVSRRYRTRPTVFSSRVTVRRQTAKPLFSISVKDPAVPTDPTAVLRRDLSMAVLGEMLFSRSGEFYSHLFESGLVSPGMSYGSSVGCFALASSPESYGYYDLSGESDSPETVFDEFVAFMQRTREGGLDPAEFERARRILYADYVASYDSAEDIASLLSSYAVDGLCAYDFFDVVESLDFGEICALFDRTFRPSQYALSVVLPLEQD